MDAGRFDQITTAVASTTSRRAVLGGLLGGVAGLLAREEAPAKKRKRCKKEQTRCSGKCVNTNTDENHCGACGTSCPRGERCLNGRCYSDDVCPAQHQACPNFKRCGIEDSDCFCGTSTGGETVCFQDENFCEEPRPCQNTSDCENGRVCVETSACCEDFDLPDQPRTCLLPCENLTEERAKSGKSANRSNGGHEGPGSR
jgi:hypothetical protein